jgi:hypothetical protein
MHSEAVNETPIAMPLTIEAAKAPPEAEEADEMSKAPRVEETVILASRHVGSTLRSTTPVRDTRMSDPRIQLL